MDRRSLGDLSSLLESLVYRGPGLLLGIDDRMLFPGGEAMSRRRFRIVIEIEAESDPREWLFEDRIVIDDPYRIEAIEEVKA